LKQLADKAGLSFNGFILSKMDQLLYPIQESKEPAIKEIELITKKIQEINSAQEEILLSQRAQRYKLADFGKNEPKIQEKINEFLQKRKIPQSEIIIADEIGEDPDVVFVILSYLEKINQVEMIDQKWIKK
jgi:nucleoside-triphosphatase THEP1